MRWMLIVPLLVAGACASAGQGSPTVDPIRSQGTIGLSTNPQASAMSTTIAEPMDRVWRIMPAVYASFGIQLTTIEPSTHLVGNEGFKVRKQLAGSYLSKFIECGTTQIGPNADSYDVVLTLMTQLQPANNGGTTVTTSLESSAKPPNFGQEFSHCSTKGVLEARVMDSVNARLKR